MNTLHMKKIVSAVATGLLVLSMNPLAAMAAVPSITSTSPLSAVVGSSALTLTVNGSNFDSTSVVNFNGSPRSTTLVSGSQLTATIPASDLSASGAFNVTVTNSGSGGGTSNSAVFTVGNAAPTLSSITPSSAASGSGAFTLTANGSNFMPGSMVNFNGSPRSTTYLSSTQLTASILSSDIVNAGSFNVSVTNPAPGGGTSNALVFTATGSSSNNARPVLSSINPPSKLVGSGAFTLTLTGSNFVSGAVVRFNGLTKPTTYISANQLTAAIPAADIGTTGLYAVDVVNPTPGGGASNPMIFTVTGLGITPTLPNTGFGPSTALPLNAGVALVALAGISLVALYAWKMRTAMK